MADIHLYNTLTRRKEALIPVVPGQVSMYVCGPTVYDRAHLGNARPAIVFDTLARLLRHEYGAENVRYVRNITDVEDKIIARAAERGVSIDALTAETEAWYLEDMAAVGVAPPDAAPHATDYIAQMVAMIEELATRGHAYAADGHVLFSVESYPDYGKLSGRSVDDMIAGARVEVAPYKRDPMDFVLWKPSTPDQPGWEGPVVGGERVGRGRPGWHIECSAMAHALLGETFDIHGGGNDLMFPHHENEIAQSACVHPGGGFARIWMHNEMLQVEGKKMSKSLGNFFTVRDLLRGTWNGGWKVPGEVIRFAFLKTHYRKPTDWTEEKATEALEELEKWALALAHTDTASEVPHDLIVALSDDLNTHGAITVLRDLWKSGDRAGLRAGLEFLGLLLPIDPSRQEVFDWLGKGEAAREKIKGLIQTLMNARAQKDFARADALRDGLMKAGVSLSYEKDGTVTYKREAGFDASKLEALE